jgi:deoxyadenosine/deoxycytidine kinase
MNREKGKSKLFIAVSGCIGVGKTKLTRLLSQALGWHAHYENLIDNPYLADFYEDMSRWSFHLQIYFLTQRFKILQEVQKWPDSFIQDRTINEDAEIFAQTLHELGYMSARDFQNYQNLFSIMTPYIQEPDLILFLYAPVDELIRRIMSRGRDFELTIDPKYLQALSNEYDRWIDKLEKNNKRILRLNTTEKEFAENTEDLRLLVQYIRELENQSWLNVD